MAWSNLPVDLLYCISSYLPVVDFLRFSIVCTSWNSVLANNNYFRIHNPPSLWLVLFNNVRDASDMLTYCDHTIEKGGCHGRFSPPHSHIFGRRCIGSKDGWLVTLDEMNLQPYLMNPLTKAEITLPSLFTASIDQSWTDIFYDYDGSYRIDVESFGNLPFEKIVLSSNNSSGTAVVMYGYHKLLAIARPGDHTWVLGPHLPPYDIDVLEQFNDVYFYEEDQRFYAITYLSAVLSFDLDGQNVKLICPSIQHPYDYNFECKNYIIILSGTLLKIRRKIQFIDTENDEDYIRKTTKISIFKFVSDVVASSCSFSQWISINDLGGYSLFVGCNHTFSLHHKIIPGIRPNCIYFTDHWNDDFSPNDINHDVGFFDLHNDCFQYFHDSDSHLNYCPPCPPSIWFTPSLS